MASFSLLLLVHFQPPLPCSAADALHSHSQDLGLAAKSVRLHDCLLKSDHEWQWRRQLAQWVIPRQIRPLARSSALNS